MRAELSVAMKARDFPRSLALLEEFIASAEGEDLGAALALKAGVLFMMGGADSLMGLALVDRALELMHSPDHVMLAAINGLAFCNRANDPARGERYADIGYTLFQYEFNEEEARAHRSGLQLNLGRWAELRGDLIQAYWHYNQALMAFERGHISKCCEPREGLFWANLHVARVCLAMKRPVEALDALDVAAKHIFNDNTQTKWDALSSQLGTQYALNWAEAQ